MKTFLTISLLSTSLFFFGLPATAQVTNLKVNGYSSNFILPEESGIMWEFDIPVGGTAESEIWLDLNANGVIDPGIDKSMFNGGFKQTDGDPSGNDGPPDMDGVANGHFTFTFANMHIAPASYIFHFTHNGVGPILAGTVTPLASPAYTIAGKLNVFAGVSPQNISVYAKKGEDTQWGALTDAAGNYLIRMNESAAGITFSVGVEEDMSPYNVSPKETNLLMNQSYTGINFSLVQPDAKVVGFLTGSDGHVFANVEISVQPRYGGRDKRTFTNESGFYQFGFSADEISSEPIWQVETKSDMVAPAYFPPRTLVSLHDGDSIRVDLIALRTNATITGKVLVDGLPPAGKPYRIFAYARSEESDGGQTETYSDPTTGDFTLNVVTTYTSYGLGIDDLPDGLGFEWVNAEPGASGLIMKVETVSWLPQESNTNQNLNAVTSVNGKIAWIAGDGGTLLATTDGGNIWNKQTTNTSATINSVYFVNSTTGWFVADGGIIKKTTNGGANWTSQNSTTAYNLYSVIFEEGNDQIGWAAGGNDMGNSVILKTTNGGTTWTAQTSPVGGKVKSLTMMNRDFLWAQAGGTVIWTQNGGTTWQTVSGNGLEWGIIAVKAANWNSIWAVGQNSGVYHSTDAGDNWTFTGTNGCGFFDGAALASANVENAWVAGPCGQILRTVDGGQTWNNQLIPNDYNNTTFRAIHFISPNIGWAVGNNGTILATVNGGSKARQSDWGRTNSPTKMNLLTVKAVNRNVVWAAGDSGTVLLTVNAGESWNSVGGGTIGKARIFAIDALSDQKAWVAAWADNTAYLLRTTNGGANWTVVYTQPNGWLGAIKMSDNLNGFAGGDPVDGKWTVLKTSDGGATWARIPNEPLQEGTESGINNCMAVVGTQHIWFGNGGNGGSGLKIYSSEDGGATWNSYPVKTYVESISFSDENNGIITNRSGDHSLTSDGGKTWTQPNWFGPGQSRAGGSCFAIGNERYIAAGGFVYKSKDKGATWTSSFSGGLNSGCLSFVADPTGTVGYGVGGNGWIVTVGGYRVGVEDETVTPDQFALFQNYPNPFNPETTLSFSLPFSSMVTLKIYDVLGREVSTVFSGQLSSGKQSLHWNASGMASGVYFYRLEAAGKSQTKKLVLLR